jgi:prevent-host-death family protein
MVSVYRLVLKWYLTCHKIGFANLSGSYDFHGGVAMPRKYSISEARNQLAALIRDVEEMDQPIQITRRGQSVAIILSTKEYARLSGKQPKQGFWQAYLVSV